MTSQVDFQVLALESAIEALQEKINTLRGVHVTRTTPKTEQPIGKKRGRKPGTIMSPEARQRIREAQRKRWDAVAAAKQPPGAEETSSEEAAEEVPARALSAAVGQLPGPQGTEETRTEIQQKPRRGRPPGKGGKRGD